jgi:hypothetical protein
MQIPTNLITNPWFVLLLAVGGMLLTAIGLYLARSRKPTYWINSVNLIRDSNNVVPDLGISVSGYGQPIRDLTVSNLVFWNAGRGTITKAEVVQPDPVTIEINDKYVILDARILFQRNERNGFERTISRERKRVTLKFKFIDWNEGAVIQVIHTGTAGKDLTMRGTIKDAGRIRRKSDEEVDTKRFFFYFILHTLANNN